MGNNTAQLKGRVIIDTEIIDTLPVQSMRCMLCTCDIDLTTAHYGRVFVGWVKNSKEFIGFRISPVASSGIALPTTVLPNPTTLYKEQSFPKMKKGYACTTCFDRLHAITWRDKNGHLRRAFDTLKDPAIKVDSITPVYDEAKPITKGLYAPHASRRKAGHLVTRDIGNAPNGNTVVLEEHQIKNESPLGFKKDKDKAKGLVTVLIEE